MILHTIIGEYDILQAQNREMKLTADSAMQTADTSKQKQIFSTDPDDYLWRTKLCQF